MRHLVLEKWNNDLFIHFSKAIPRIRAYLTGEQGNSITINARDQRG